MVYYNNLCVFGKSLFQPEYRILKKAFEEQLFKESILRLFDNQNEIMQLSLSPVILLGEMAKNQTQKSASFSKMPATCLTHGNYHLIKRILWYSTTYC